MKTVKNLCQVLYILALLVSFTNCQNDTVAEMQQAESVEQAPPFKSSLLTRQDVETNSKLFNQMRSLNRIQSNGIAKSAYNGVYDFTVDADVVKYIESTTSNTHSYTLPIERDLPTSELENLVFTYNATTDDYSASIMTYHFSTVQKQEFITYGYTSSNYQISHQPIYVNIDDVLSKASMPIPCTTNYTVYHITPDTGETFFYGSNGVVQNACEHEHDDINGPCQTYTVIEIDCPDGGSAANASHSTSGHNSASTTGSDYSNAGSNSGTGNGNQSSSTNNQTTMITSPIPKDELQQIADIYNEVVGEGNWTINENEQPSSDAPNIESAEQLQAYFDSLTDGNFEFESSEPAGGNNIWEHYRMTFSQSLDTYIKASVKRKIFSPGILTTMQPNDILGVRTRVLGSTTIYNWTQLDDEDISNAASSPSVELLPESNRIVIKVNAEMEINSSSFGRTVTVVRSIIVEIRYNILTGQMVPYYSHWYYDDGLDD